jgi:hypothetical protein
VVGAAVNALEGTNSLPAELKTWNTSDTVGPQSMHMNSCTALTSPSSPMALALLMTSVYPTAQCVCRQRCRTVAPRDSADIPWRLWTATYGGAYGRRHTVAPMDGDIRWRLWTATYRGAYGRRHIHRNEPWRVQRQPLHGA